MALNVKIDKSGKSEKSIQVDSIDHSFTRMPTQAGLAGQEDSDKVDVFSLDLGQCIESITVSGIVEENAAFDKYDFEDIIRNWWAYGDTASDMLKLTLSSGQAYYGAIKHCSFRQLGGVEDRWTFSLLFVVKEKV